MTTSSKNALSNTAIRGGATTLAGQAVKISLHLVGLVVLARLLGPSDFGLVAMVTAVVGIADIIRDMGLSSAAMQAKTLGHQQHSNLFWINTGLGLLLSVLCIACSSLIADMYGEPRLAAITVAIAIVFFANGFQTQFQAQLARNFRFLALSVTDIIAMFLGLIVAIVFGVLGAGFWALVGQLVAQSMALAISRVFVANWCPTWPRRDKGMVPLLRFGRNLVLTQLLVYISSNIDSVLIGARFGPTSLGLYNRAFQLLTMPLNQIFSPLTNVALPTLSRSQDDADRFLRQIERAQLILGYGVVTMFAVAFALAEPIVELVFGHHWAGSIPIFRILAVAGAFQAISYVSYWVFLARGLTGSHLKFSLVSRSLLVVMIVSGSLWGIYGVAAGYAAGVALGWFAALAWLRHFHQLNIHRLISNGMRIICIGVIVAAVGFLSWNQLDTFFGVLGSVALSTSAMLLAVLSLMWLPPVRRDFTVLAVTLKQVWRVRRSKSMQ